MKSTFPAARLSENWIAGMRGLFRVWLVLAWVSAAEAHVGNENNTEIRVYADSMRVVVRTSIPFAWTILGAQAPPMADEAGRVVAKPLLTAAASDLIEITVGGKPMVPESTDCVFEIHDDVAFILNFKRPDEWPAKVEAKFFERFTTLDTGTIAVFDYSASRFSRDLEPIAQKLIDQRNPSLSFMLEAAASPMPAPTPSAMPPPADAPTATSPRMITAVSLLLVAAAVIGFLARRRLLGPT